MGARVFIARDAVRVLRGRTIRNDGKHSNRVSENIWRHGMLKIDSGV